MLNDTTDIEVATRVLLQSEALYTSGSALRLPTVAALKASFDAAQTDYETKVKTRCPTLPSQTTTTIPGFNPPANFPG
jgi:hypothetical protein